MKDEKLKIMMFIKSRVQRTSETVPIYAVMERFNFGESIDLLRELITEGLLEAGRHGPFVKMTEKGFNYVQLAPF